MRPEHDEHRQKERPENQHSSSLPSSLILGPGETVFWLNWALSEGRLYELEVVWHRRGSCGRGPVSFRIDGALLETEMAILTECVDHAICTQGLLAIVQDPTI